MSKFNPNNRLHESMSTIFFKCKTNKRQWSMSIASKTKAQTSAWPFEARNIQLALLEKNMVKRPTKGGHPTVSITETGYWGLRFAAFKNPPFCCENFCPPLLHPSFSGLPAGRGAPKASFTFSRLDYEKTGRWWWWSRSRDEKQSA